MTTILRSLQSSVASLRTVAWPMILRFEYSLLHSFTPSLTHSHTHSFTHSLTHSLVQLRKRESGKGSVTDADIKLAEEKFHDSKNNAENAMMKIVNNDVCLCLCACVYGCVLQAPLPLDSTMQHFPPACAVSTTGGAGWPAQGPGAQHDHTCPDTSRDARKHPRCPG